MKRLLNIAVALAFTLAVNSPAQLSSLGASKAAAGGGFTPVNHGPFTTGTAATETIPAGGATSVRITVRGSGGSGRHSTLSGSTCGGGGGGGYSIATYALISGDAGVNFTYTVGVGGAGKSGATSSGSTGTASTVTGTINAGAVSQTGNGGQGGTTAAVSGGTASGGTNGTSVTNTTGGTSTAASAGYGLGGAGAGPGGGAGDAGGLGGSAPGGGGSGANNDIDTVSYAGAAGSVYFEYN